MKVISCVAGLICSVALTGTAFAQVQPGMNEVGISGKLDVGKYSDEEDNLAFLELNGFYGYFLTDRIEVGPSLNVTKLEGEDATGAYAAFLDYHFGDTSSPIVPFAEVSFGRGFGEGDIGDPTFFTLGAGAKMFFANGGGALIVHPFYRRIMYDEDERGFSGRNEFAISIGVGIYFR